MGQTRALTVEDTGLRDRAPIFVLGSARSGTTLLQVMLNAHPAISVIGELHFFDRILQLKKHLPALGTAEGMERLFELLPRMEAIARLPGVDDVLVEVRGRLAALPEPTYEALYGLILDSYARAAGARRAGEKTTANLRYLDDLVQIFPGCRLIHIVRDPRGSVASRLKVPWTSGDVVTNAIKWKMEVAAAQAFMTASPRQRHQMIEARYEDLIADPAAVLRRICDFIGEPYDERMHDYHRSAGALVQHEPWKAGVARPVYSTSAASWRSSLTRSQIFLIEQIAGATMRRHGYAPEGVGPAAVLGTPLQLCREAGRWLAFKLRERRNNERQHDVSFADNTKLYRMLVRAETGSEKRGSKGGTSTRRS